MRPFCPCDSHQVNYRMHPAWAGMLMGLKGSCRDSEHCQDMGYDQSGVRDRWGQGLRRPWVSEGGVGVCKDQYDGGACFQALCRHEPGPAAMKRLVTQAYALDIKALARGGWLFPFSTYEWVWRTYNGTKTISMTTTVLQDHSTGDCSSR
jgi:hypothetical protein